MYSLVNSVQKQLLLYSCYLVPGSTGNSVHEPNTGRSHICIEELHACTAVACSSRLSAEALRKSLNSSGEHMPTVPFLAAITLCAARDPPPPQPGAALTNLTCIIDGNGTLRASWSRFARTHPGHGSPVPVPADAFHVELLPAAEKNGFCP